MNSLCLLYDFEASGGVCQSLEVLKRTAKYTDRFCRFTFGEDVFYAKLRVYVNGIARISLSGVDDKDMWISEETEKRSLYARKRSDWLNRDTMLENKSRRDMLCALYKFAFIMALVLLVATVVVTFMGIIGRIECGIYVALLMIYLVLQRKIWRKKIIQIGHDEMNYYDIYK